MRALCGCVGVVVMIGILHYPPLTLLTSDSIHILSPTPDPPTTTIYRTPHTCQFKDVAKLDEAAIDAVINGGGEAKQ